MIWSLHGDGSIRGPEDVVLPEERLSWPRTIGVGLQHMVIMFSATFVTPLVLGFPVSTALLASGLGTLLFLALTRNRVPSYLGGSAAFFAPVLAAKEQGGIAVATGAILITGLCVFLVGLITKKLGAQFIHALLPPMVIGTIVVIIGLVVAPVAKNSFDEQPGVGLFTLIASLAAFALLRGFLGRMSVVIGVAAGYLFAVTLGGVDFTPVQEATWFGLPEFTAPEFQMRAILLVVPAVLLVLLAENAGHVQAVGAMCDRDLRSSIPDAYMGDGAATMLAGAIGAPGVTTYSENIGTMAMTRVYSTAAYVIAALVAIALGLIPKIGALVASVPAGVLGGVLIIIFGMNALLGVQIWITAGIDLRNPINLITAAVPVTIGAAGFAFTAGEYEISPITIGSLAAILIFHTLRWVHPSGGALATGETTITDAQTKDPDDAHA